MSFYEQQYGMLSPSHDRLHKKVLDEERNRYPGDPMRPVSGSELNLGDLDGYYCEPKLDGNRVLLVHGLAFNRHGKIYSRDPEGFLEGHWETLTDLYPYKIFDLEYMPTGKHKGKAALLDIPCNRGASDMHKPKATYLERRHVMEARLPHQRIGGNELEHDLFILPRTYDANGTYKLLKALWESLYYQADFIWEGIVAKHKDSQYLYGNKGDWIKIRYK